MPAVCDAIQATRRTHAGRRALRLLVVISIVVSSAWVVGCQRRSPSPAAAAPAARRQAGDLSDVADVTIPLVTAHHPPSVPQSSSSAPVVLVLPSEAEPTAGDAQTEGWTTEAFSEQASRQLAQLADLFVRPEPPTAAELAGFCAAEFRAGEVLPSGWERVFHDEIATVERAVGDAEWPARDVAVRTPREAFAPLLEQFATWSDRHAKFKLYRVEFGTDVVTTRQYFHLSGRQPTQAREHNSTWVIEWTPPSAGAPPQIRSVRAEQVEQSTVRTDGPAWLNDCTASLLSANDCYRRELLPGIDYWLPRLEAASGVYNFAYHGIALGDVNGDQLDDVYFCQTGGLPNRLFVQRPDGTLDDVSASAGVDYLDNTRSALLVDLDNDGDSDMVMALTSGLLFLENDGRARFAPRARINSVRQGFSLAAADYDQDGRLDVYICVYYAEGEAVSKLPLPMPYFDAKNGGQNYLIRNLGDWKFADVTTAAGLDDDNSRFSFAAVWEDDDNDGDPDLLVVNDFGPNQLYRNDKGRFRNVAPTAGLLDGAFGMSATSGDYDHDGRFDLYVSNMFSAAGNRVTFQPQFKSDESADTRARFQYLARGNSLFRNRGDGTYEDTSVPMGVTMGRWSWGSLFVDLNNDRWDDLIVANGFITGTKTEDL